MSKWRKFVVCGDSHGDMADKKAIKAFLGFCDVFRPDIRIHLGDLIDFRAIRRGCSPEEKQESMQADYNAGTKFLRDMKATVWLMGNHDDRPNQIANSTSGVMRDYGRNIASDMLEQANEIGCKVLPYCKRRGVFELGKVRAGGYRVIHGFRSGIYALKAEIGTYGRVIHGHIHCRGSVVGSTFDPSEGHSIGCLCRVDMDYNKTHEVTLRQENGWGFGIVNERTGAVYFQHARKIGNQWITPSEFGVL